MSNATMDTSNVTDLDMVTPAELTELKLIDVFAYTLMFAVGAPANFKVLKNLVQGKLFTKSRHHFLLFNLALADSVVSFIMIPTEIGWRLTNAWKAGNVSCKLFQFVRVFGPYASSMVLICISIDRYYAVVKPFTYITMDKRINCLLKAAWTLSFFLSLPQIVFFNVQTHPHHEWFLQCVNFNYFPHKWHEKLYNVVSLIFLYFLPLMVILICYSSICWESFRRTRNVPNEPAVDGKDTRRESRGDVAIELETYCSQATPSVQPSEYTHRNRRQSTLRRNILQQTVVIVVAFIICWTPYVVITSWFQIDSNSAKSLDRNLNGVLFLFAVSNSSINPFIYGKFVKSNRQAL